MKNKKLNILHVNTLDLAGGGGAAKVAWDLFETHNLQQNDSYLAVGRKQIDHPKVLEIPKQHPKSKWEKFWFSLEKKTNPFVGRIKGAGRLKNFFHRTAWPKVLFDSIRGFENFNFSGSKKLLNICPVKPDIVNLHNLHGNYFDLRILPWLSKKIPTIITMHDSWLLSGHCAHSFNCEKWRTGCGRCPNLDLYPEIGRDGTKHNWNLKKNIYHKSKLYLVTPCKWLMKKVDESILVDKIIKKKIIHHGIDLSVFKPKQKKPIRKKLGIDESAFVILFAAQNIRENPWKDYQALKKAIIQLSKKNFDKKIIFLCLGEKAQSEKINDIEINFIPYIRDTKKVAEYFQLADLYVHPAKAETFGLTIIEALACGTPVVATSVGGIPELITNKTTGILVKEQNETELFKAIMKILQNRLLLKEMSINARKDAKLRFDLNVQSKKYLDFYNEILDCGKG